MGKNSYTGGCLCGNIRYALTEPPLFVGTCHCRMCQKWTGRPMFASATFATSAVKVLFGSPKKYKSSEVSERFFVMIVVVHYLRAIVLVGPLIR